MGSLLPTLTQAKLDGQRDVVKNEKRQRVDNAPYGQAFVELSALLFPPGHPYSWPVIGSMEDLSAASLDDVIEFFKTYYVPNNASLVVAGDIEIEPARKLVEKWFGGVARGGDVPPPVAPPATLVHGQAQDHHRPGAAPAPLHGVALAGLLRTRRRDDGHGVERALGRQELAPVSPAGLRDAGRTGRGRRTAVAGARQRLRGRGHRAGRDSRSTRSRR